MRFLSPSHTHTRARTCARVDIVSRFIFPALACTPFVYLHDALSIPCTHAIYLSLNIDMCHTNSFSLLARCPCVARNIRMHLYEKFILWEKRMNEGMPYLQMWRGVWVSFCKIAIVSFLCVRYKSDDLFAGWQAHHHHQLCFL